MKRITCCAFIFLLVFLGFYASATLVHQKKGPNIIVPLPNLPVGAIPLEMVWIIFGENIMGSPDSEQDRDSKEDLHLCKSPYPFYMGIYEITQAQWTAVMGDNPSIFKDNPNHPVECVSWDDCQQFIAKLNQIVNGNKLGQGIFLLPTEEQWEYACRALSTTRFYWGDDPKYSEIENNAWYKDNSNSQTHKVGTKLPNRWGLYDMNGNVWEWCQNTYWDTSDYYTFTECKVIRGGSMREPAKYCRSASRAWDPPFVRFSRNGLRVIRSIPLKPGWDELVPY